MLILQIGKHIMRGASETLTPVVLELGGKDPFIVCEDADIDQLLPFALRGTYQNAGQNCVGAERFYVYSKVHDEFVSKVCLSLPMPCLLARFTYMHATRAPA